MSEHPKELKMKGKRILSGRRPHIVTDREILAQRREAGLDDGPAQVMIRPVDARPLLTTGNGTLNVDWLAGDRHEEAVVSHPHFGWFCSAHKRHVKIGTWSLRLTWDGQRVPVWETRSWYSHSAVPNTYLHPGLVGDAFGLIATGVCPIGEQAWVMRLEIKNRTDAPHNLGLVLEGNLCVGDEASFSRDEILANPNCPLEPLPPVKLECEPTTHGIRASNHAASIYATLQGSEPVSSVSLARKFDKHRIGGGWQKAPEADWYIETADFSLTYNLRLEPGETKEFVLIVGLGNTVKEVEETTQRLASKGALKIEEETCGYWKSVLAPFENVALPDRLLEAALRRCCVYPVLLSIPMGEENFFITDHVTFVTDFPRDCFYQAAALLYFKPEDVAGNLRFLFESALPKSGVGAGTVASGDSPHKAQGDFLLDLVSYPFLELYRYWRFTGDSALVAKETTAQAMDLMLEEIEQYRSRKTGLYTSMRRSSDEACLLPLFIPGNMLLVCALEQVAEMAEEAQKDERRAGLARERAAAIRKAVAEHAVKDHEEFGPVYAWEVDEDGRYFLYDQADLPNLISMPYWGFCAADDPVYQNTLKFAFSQENEGYAETADGWFAAMADGTKTYPEGPWPLGIMSELIGCPGDPERIQQIVDWLHHAVTPSLQLSEIVDKHTGALSSRAWFIWPTSLFVMAYVEILCGIRVGKTLRIEPHPPAGWDAYESPLLRIRGHEVRVRIEHGKPTVWLDGEVVEAREIALD